MLIKIGDIFDIEKGSVQSSKCVEGIYDFITASEDWKTHNEYTHECEALIFAMAASGSLGRTHYVNGKFVTSDLCFILTPKSKYANEINLKFYFYYFNTFRERIVKATATGTSKLAINRKMFSDYEIHFIDIKKQLHFIDKIEQMQVFSRNVFAEIEKQEKYVSSLRQSILQQAVEGKLCPQNPTDEPASVLLYKIQKEKDKLIAENKITQQSKVLLKKGTQKKHVHKKNQAESWESIIKSHCFTRIICIIGKSRYFSIMRKIDLRKENAIVASDDVQLDLVLR